MSYVGGTVSTIKEYTADSINSSSKTYGTQIKRAKNGVQEVLYQYDGNDRKFDSEDDLITRYTFDFGARTINATTLDFTQNTIYGVTAAAYTANSTTSQKNNRVERDAQSGKAGINLLVSGGLEAHDSFSSASNYWLRMEPHGTGYNAVVKTGETARTGSSAIKTYVNQTAPADAQRIAMYQDVTLDADTEYTFSAYVNTTGITNFTPNDTSGGVYLLVQDSSGEKIGQSDILSAKTTTDIENGWQRLTVTFKSEASGSYRCFTMQENAYGSAYFDDLQLEKGTAASNVNLIQDGTFTFSRNDDYDSNWNVTATHAREWNDKNLWLVSEDWYGEESNRVGWIIGNKSGMKRGWQTVPINGPATETYLLSGWAKASSAAYTESTLTSPLNNTKRYFGMFAQCNYIDGTKEFFCMPFNDDYDGWQYASCVIAPKKENQSKTIQNIMVYMAYDYNINKALFDNISLRKEPCSTYTYDSKGNLTAVNATGNSAADFSYAAGTTKLTKSTSQATGTYEYSYDDTRNNHLVTKIKNDGVSMNISYDAMGNSTSSTTRADSGGSTLVTTAEFSADGSQLLSQTNANGQSTSYAYNAYRNVRNTTDSAGTVTEFNYYANNDRSRQSYISGVIAIERGYENGLLSSLTRAGYDPDRNRNVQHYYMAHDIFGNLTSISVGSRTLASYDYGKQNGNLNSMTYGNGETVSYKYDELGRITSESWNNGKKYLYFYNAEGNLAKKLDDDTKEAVNYEYDSLGRLIRSSQTAESGQLQRTEHIYDTENRISSQSWQLGDTTYHESYSYNKNDGSLQTMYLDAGGSISFSYDALKRLQSREGYAYTQTYGYRDLENGKTTTQISSLSYGNGTSGGTVTPFTINYSCDATGNISSISSAARSGLNAIYTYDEQGQLLTETNTSGSYTYTYDTYGNIRSSSNGTTNNTYTYGDEEWLDLLTAYNGEEITYDEIGNPLSYYNGTRWTFTWQNGRQLATASKSGTNVSYTYDLAGIRDSKTVGNLTYNYVAQNGQVVRQTWGDHVMDFIYDNSGKPYAVKYDGETYYYVLNQQNDVIALVTHYGMTVALYYYDAWGRNIGTWSATNYSVGVNNPLRYRGYYFDKETGLYYLGSRYYDPVVKRFINADNASLVTANPDGMTDKNLFAYCDNNPVMRADGGGEFWIEVAVGVAVGIAAQYVGDVLGNIKAGNSGKDVFKPTSSLREYAAAGISGAIAAIPCGKLIGTMIAGAAGNIAGDYIRGNITSIKSVGVSAFKGAAANVAGYVVGKAMAYVKANQIKHMSRSARKIYLRDSFYMNSQKYANANLRTFANNPVAQVEKRFFSYRAGLYATITSTSIGRLFG